MGNSYSTPLNPQEIEKNFADINPALTDAEALYEANRCLYCYDAPCMHACPTHIDVPGFIQKIASGNLLGSARVIFDANPIGATCARVCPVEVLCEGACVEKTLLQKPIEIGRLQRHATDYAIEKGRQIYEKGTPNGKSVGIVGSGPAGLSCAAYLARLGYDVNVYEQKPLAGGLDTYGMAEYKMSQKVSFDEVASIRRMGVEFRTNTRIVGSKGSPPYAAESTGGFMTPERGVDAASADAVVLSRVAFDDLQRDHDAVFLAVGLGETNRMNIPGEDLEGVYDALHFIEKVKSRKWTEVPLGKIVAVIGAGNTAIDAVTQAKRLGAKRVLLIYRRTEADAPAYDYELELAKKDGVEFIWQAAVVELLSEGKSRRVAGIRCERTDGSGEQFAIGCDMVIKAVGQQKMRSFFENVAEVAIDEKGRVVVNEHMQTTNPKVFAGGDCANGGAEAVDAAQMGKLAARAIHANLTGEIVHFAGAEVAHVEPVRTHHH